VKVYLGACKAALARDKEDGHGWLCISEGSDPGERRGGGRRIV
jgi:hypothetical protein